MTKAPKQYRIMVFSMIIILIITSASIITIKNQYSNTRKVILCDVPTALRISSFAEKPMPYHNGGGWNVSFIFVECHKPRWDNLTFRIIAGFPLIEFNGINKKSANYSYIPLDNSKEPEKYFFSTGNPYYIEGKEIKEFNQSTISQVNDSEMKTLQNISLVVIIPYVGFANRDYVRPGSSFLIFSDNNNDGIKEITEGNDFEIIYKNDYIASGQFPVI